MKLLIAYHSFLAPDTNAGCLRLFEVIRILCAQGCRVTFLARENKGLRAPLEALGVECVCDEELGLSVSPLAFEKFLHKRQFRAAVFVYHFIYNHYAPVLKAFLPACHCILDTVDIHFLRLRRQAVFQPEMAAQADTVERDEKRALRDADSLWVVTPTERDLLQPLAGGPKTKFFIIPTVHPVLQQRPGFHDRAGLVFLGSYNHDPNVDAVKYLVDEILPPLRLLLPDAPVIVAGSGMPAEFHEFAHRDAHLHMAGFVEDHRALLAGARVGIAPLRFGAGMKGKIGEFLACGLPCVTTTIGAEGMGLSSGRDVLVADEAQQFAQYAAQLYTDAALWQKLSERGVRYIEERVAPQAIVPAVRDALACAEAFRPGLARRLRQPALRRQLLHPARHDAPPRFLVRLKRRLLRFAWVHAIRTRLARF